MSCAKQNLSKLWGNDEFDEIWDNDEFESFKTSELLWLGNYKIIQESLFYNR